MKKISALSSASFSTTVHARVLSSEGLMRHLGRSALPFLALSLGGLSACAVDPAENPDTDGATSETQAPLVGGTTTLLRPEIGRLSIYGGCTATLVDPSFVITAAHCVKYTSTAVSGTFSITTAAGVTKPYAVDRTFSLGAGDPNNLNSGLGASDVALVRRSEEHTSELQSR